MNEGSKDRIFDVDCRKIQRTSFKCRFGYTGVSTSRGVGGYGHLFSLKTYFNSWTSFLLVKPDIISGNLSFHINLI